LTAPAHPSHLLLSLLACVVLSHQVHAQEPADTFKLKISPSLHRYVRFGYTYVRPNDRAGNAVDLDGPVVKYGDESTPGLNNGTPEGLNAVGSLLFLSANMRVDHPSDYESQGLGTPQGESIKAGGGGNWTVTLGTYLDEAHQWAVEAYVAGLPIETHAYGAGRVGSQEGDSVDLGRVVTTKQLGPIVIGRRVFGDKGNRFRPSVGLGVAYIAFLEAKASWSLEQYVGGSTRVKLQNMFAAGVFLGGDYRIDERWSLNATLGYLKARTKARIITRVDPETMGRSLAAAQTAKDIGPQTLTAVQFTNGTLTGGPSAINGPTNTFPAVLRELARARTGDPGYVGTYTREIRTQLDPWLLTLSVGYAF